MLHAKSSATYHRKRLEALAVDDRGPRLVVLLLRDPHLLEGGERGEDGSANPDGVLALRRGDDLDLHSRRGEGGHLLGETLADAREHGGTTGEHDVGVEVLADVDVAFMIVWNMVSWMPDASLPMKDGWKRTSGQRKRSLPMVITLPSGSSYDFSREEDSAAVFISASKSIATYASFSLMSRTISRSAVVVKEYPRSVRIFIMLSVRSRPARSIRRTAWGSA